MECAGCIVLDNGSVLVIETKRGIELPKGIVEPGEAPEDAAVRETAEETGATVELTGAPALTVQKRSGRVFGFYPARYVSGELKPQSEEGIVDVLWMPLGDAREAIRRSQRPVLDAVLRRRLAARLLRMARRLVT